MSSKLFRPGNVNSAEPVAWRQAGQVAGAGSAAKSDPDAQWQQRLNEAYKTGHRDGESAGHERAAGEFRQATDRMARALEDLAELRPRLRREAEADMLRLALAIARRVLRRELAVDPEAMHGLVLGALEKLQGQEITKVRVHPSHAPLLNEWLQRNAHRGSIEVIPDGSKELGAAIFETERGNLDASVESQLEEIERGLADCLRRRT